MSVEIRACWRQASIISKYLQKQLKTTGKLRTEVILIPGICVLLKFFLLASVVLGYLRVDPPQLNKIQEFLFVKRFAFEEEKAVIMASRSGRTVMEVSLQDAWI